MVRFRLRRVYASGEENADSWCCRFAWANGLFGQMILDLRERKPHLLEKSYQ